MCPTSREERRRHDDDHSLRRFEGAYAKIPCAVSHVSVHNKIPSIVPVYAPAEKSLARKTCATIEVALFV